MKGAMDLSDPSDFEAQLDMIDPPMTPKESIRELEQEFEQIMSENKKEISGSEVSFSDQLSKL